MDASAGFVSAKRALGRPMPLDGHDPNPSAAWLWVESSRPWAVGAERIVRVQHAVNWAAAQLHVFFAV